jgi:hypothetical protein
MVFDILKLEVNARSISHALLYSSDSTTEVERLLRMLEKNKVLISRNGYYRLYARQDEEFNTLKEGRPSVLQMIWIKMLESFSVCNSVQFLELGNEQVFFTSFPSTLNIQKVQARCKLMSYVLKKRVYYTSNIRSENKHELSAVLLSLTRNIDSKPQHGLKFKWLKHFIPKVLINKTRALTRFATLSIQDSFEYNLNSWLTEMESRHDFKVEYEHRLNHIRHWLLPQIGLKTQQNRIV